MRLFFEGFEGCCLFGLCDAMLFALFVSRLAVNNIGAEGAGRLSESIGRAAIVVTTSTWCSLDTWNTGNEESHTLHPFKEWVCGFKLPCKPGSLNHNCRFPNRVAEDRHDIQSSLRNTLHVKYFIIIKGKEPLGKLTALQKLNLSCTA